MRFVHRLVIVAGLFMELPLWLMFLREINDPHVSPNELLIKLTLGWIIAAIVIYPTAWLFGGFRRV